MVTLLLLIVWVGSKKHLVYAYAKPTFGLGAGGGLIAFGWERPWGLPVDWKCDLEEWDNEWEWWYEVRVLSGGTEIGVPTWMFILLTAIPTLLIWRRDRRRDPNACPKCGYSRTGLPADRACPECGTAASPR